MLGPQTLLVLQAGERWWWGCSCHNQPGLGEGAGKSGREGSSVV